MARVPPLLRRGLALCIAVAFIFSTWLLLFETVLRPVVLLFAYGYFALLAIAVKLIAKGLGLKKVWQMGVLMFVFSLCLAYAAPLVFVSGLPPGYLPETYIPFVNSFIFAFAFVLFEALSSKL